MKLLQETNAARVSHEGKKIFIEGLYMRANFLNKNGRVYPLETLRASVDAVQEKIKNGEMLGQLGHPNTIDGDLSRTSHVVTEIRQQGEQFHGKSIIIDQGAGRVATALIEAGARLGISSRGIGDVRPDRAGSLIVQPNFKLITCDLVSNASTPGAFAKIVREAILSESLDVESSGIAMRILRELGYPDLADLQKRNCYDWDAKAGNQFTGSSGFSVEDKRTYLQRLESDRANILQQLANLQNKIELAQDGLSPSQIQKYADASRSPSLNAMASDPFKRNRAKNEFHRQRVNEAVRGYAVDLLSRIAKGV